MLRTRKQFSMGDNVVLCFAIISLPEMLASKSALWFVRLLLFVSGLWAVVAPIDVRMFDISFVALPAAVIIINC